MTTSKSPGIRHSHETFCSRNKCPRAEFWAFDLAKNHISQTTEVACESGFSFGVAGDGEKLYFSVLLQCGVEIEVYGAVTLRYERS